MAWNDNLTRDLERQLAFNFSDIHCSTSFSWASILFSWHAHEWLSAQRVFLVGQGPLALSPLEQAPAVYTASSIRDGMRA